MSTSSLDSLPTQFDPLAVERAIYERWLAAGVFTAAAERSNRIGGDREPFTIVIPPPNVTAVLHLGHALDNVAQDVLIRWRRMAGDDTLWVPGTDHAGIATQNVVEKLIWSTEGKTRFDVGRTEFVRRTETFVAETGDAIQKQLEAIGSSCDWTRMAYTLSPELSRAVREAFVRLYEKGLVYRGHRVIHWCPRCMTSLSDEEAEPHETTGKLYHIAYPLADQPDRSLVVATTRPETMLGDVAVAVNPNDERYRGLIGRRVRLPIANLEIPIIADAYADPAFGTGVVKITPAHDANDFDVGMRHELPMPVIIDEHGIVREVSDAQGRVPDELRGLDRFAARERIIARLTAEGQLVKVEPHQHSVRRCYRCDTIVEPRLSDQWFVRMKPLAEPALQAVRDGTIRIVPERWEGVYVHWMENIRDWNISRQLWWGHRIPVWYCDECGTQTASRTDLDRCSTCQGSLRQDEDVLDTWFSSWLWPLSTLGWPDTTTRDYRAFYPTDVLVTGPDILFFWVARMIMAGYVFDGRHPFHTVFLHGIVRDTQHRKMSKSLANGIDPLDVVNLYGADALRWTVVSGMGLGVDQILDPDNLEQSFSPGRNFATKLWNIGRFLLGNLGGGDVASLSDVETDRLTRADQWILSRLNDAVSGVEGALGAPRPPSGVGSPWPQGPARLGMRLDAYAEVARRFVWDEVADWYVEVSKGRLGENSADRDVARAVLVHVFDNALRLLHPIVPFITEALWQRLPGRRDDELLAGASWPRNDPRFSGSEREFEEVRAAVTAIRRLRAEYAVPPGTLVEVLLSPPALAAERATADGRWVEQVLREEAALIGRLTRSRVAISSTAPSGAAAHAVLPSHWSVIVPLEGLIDVRRECERQRGELANLDKQLTSLSGRLENSSFLTRAKPEVVEAERAKHREWSARRLILADKVKALCGD
ncbi:MAG TPA: valine--tRNA ligase [Gemmatimonadaceae bacterium]|nr:valine--tRNA ligase [Gemmatimonadaceae bacterium]